MSSEVFQALHDKRTRGLTLSAEEQARLDAWYAEQDTDENAALASASASPVLTRMQAQVEAINTELQTVTQHIQKVTAENSRIRDEIIKLQTEATKRSKAQTA